MNLVREVKHFHQYVRHSQAYGSAEHDSLTHQDLYRVIFNDRVQSAFPNVEAILRLFLSMMVANCSGAMQYSINNQSSIFYAEAFAFFSAILAIPSICPNLNPNIYIFTDNLALVHSLQEVKLNLPILLDIYRTLILLKKNKFHISIFWIKSHSDSFGNNFVDHLAKEATKKYFPSQHFHPAQNLKHIILKSSIKEFSLIYNASNHRKRILKFFPNISSIFTARKFFFSNPLAGLILSGHGPIRYHTSKFDSTTSSVCRFCDQVPESIDHLIFTCPSRDFTRYMAFMEIESISGRFPSSHCDFIFNEFTWNILIKFISNFKIV